MSEQKKPVATNPNDLSHLIVTGVYFEAGEKDAKTGKKPKYGPVTIKYRTVEIAANSARKYTVWAMQHKVRSDSGDFVVGKSYVVDENGNPVAKTAEEEFDEMTLEEQDAYLEMLKARRREKLQAQKMFENAAKEMEEVTDNEKVDEFAEDEL